MIRAFNYCSDRYYSLEVRKGFWWVTGEQLVAASAVAIIVASLALLIFHAGFLMPALIRWSRFVCKWTLLGASLAFVLGLLSHMWSILAALINTRGRPALTGS